MTNDPDQLPTPEGPQFLHPIAQSERIEILDVLRGFALCGILLFNVQVFSGYIFLDPEQANALRASAADRAATFLVRLLVAGKFYSLFSLLFGVSFAMLMQRAAIRNVPFLPLFRRRQLILLMIGLCHALLVWAGDILTVYALMGFLLIPFRHRSDRTLLWWAFGLLALPVFVYIVMLAAQMPDPFATAEETLTGFGGAPNLRVQMIDGFTAGTYLQALRANAILLAGRWLDLCLTVRFPKILGMFLLGFYAGRRSIFHCVEDHMPLCRRVCWWGLGLGLPANIVLAVLMERHVYLPASPLGLLQTVASVVGVPALCLFYTAGLILLFQRETWQKQLQALAPVGHLALTNYVIQSIICVSLFYGFGLGFFSQVSATLGLGAAGITFLAQIPLSRWWLSRFNYGPLEWIWRQFTYRTRLSLIKGSKK